MQDSAPVCAHTHQNRPARQVPHHAVVPWCCCASSYAFPKCGVVWLPLAQTTSHQNGRHQHKRRNILLPHRTGCMFRWSVPGCRTHSQDLGKDLVEGGKKKGRHRTPKAWPRAHFCRTSGWPVPLCGLALIHHSPDRHVATAKPRYDRGDVSGRYQVISRFLWSRETGPGRE